MLDARIVLGNEWLELSLQSGQRYRLRYGRPGDWRVVYENGRRSVQGRSASYEFRSVEQLRYDFERDVQKTADSHRQPR